MSQERSTKVLIIGAGPAGYTAAIYAARAALSPVLLQGPQPGGQLTVTADVENYPGFADAIQGPWLMEQMQAQATHVGAEVISEAAARVDFTARPLVVATDSGTVFRADSVIIATGAQAKWLGIPSEEHFRGFGVSGCATCDGFFFRGKDVAVVGGGNTALEEALYLTHHARRITLIHRRDSFRGEKILHERVAANPKIEVRWNTVVEAIEGTENGPLRAVTGLRLKDVHTGESSLLPVEGVFIAIGHTPSTTLFQGQVGMDPEGYVVTKPDSTATDIPGVFAAGDVRDKVFRQAVTAAGMGCMAALEAERYLASHGTTSSSRSLP